MPSKYGKSTFSDNYNVYNTDNTGITLFSTMYTTVQKF